MNTREFKVKTKHWKSYRGNVVTLMCGESWWNSKIVAGGNWPQANFQLSDCPECGMEVTTIGHSPDTDEIHEYARV